MCEHHHGSPPAALRTGSRLEDGAAHAEDHAQWSRRQFLAGLGAATAGAAFWMNGVPVQAAAPAPLLHALGRLETQRTLVLIQLNGGNDGLNTVVPIENDLYYRERATLAIAKSSALRLADDVGLHPSMSSLVPLYNEGQMALVHNVGYATPDLSHFRSTDIWLSASDADDYIGTGWVGRYLDGEVPDFDTQKPDKPLAVQIGGGSSLLFQGPDAAMGMSLASVELFDRIVEKGVLYDAQAVPPTTFGGEMAYVRTVANDSFQYAGAIQSAAGTGRNGVTYPANNPLSTNLSVVARLIKGGLGSRIYLVSLGGFDTHANQANTHATLLRYLSEATAAFYNDLKAGGHEEDALIMTFSEFGRRVRQNGSAGTDHGTAAPLFLFGKGVKGGRYGTLPTLNNLDRTGNIPYETDFRSVYATVLRDWFGLDAATATGVLGGSFETLGFVSRPSSTATAREEVPEAFRLEQNYPNPFNPSTLIRYTLEQATHVRLRVFDARGALVAALVDGAQSPGAYTLPFDGGMLPSGTYYYRLETPAGVRTRSMVLLR